MSSPRIFTVCALALLLFQTTGCTSFRPLQGQLPATRAESRDVGRDIRVNKRDGEHIVLQSAWMDSTLVGGVPRGHRAEYLEIPLTEVAGLEERRFSTLKTIPFTFVVVFVGLGAVYAATMGG